MDESNIIKKFLSDIKCGSCGEHCDPADIGALGHEDDTWLFSVHCSSCDSRGLVSVGFKKCEERGEVVELTGSEQDEFSTPICPDDVLDTHVFLKEFDGDFASLFAFSPSNP